MDLIQRGLNNMQKCFTPCIYYHEIECTEKPTKKLVCDMREGQEIKDIPRDVINDCEYFKTYEDIRKKFFIEY